MAPRVLVARCSADNPGASAPITLALSKTRRRLKKQKIQKAQVTTKRQGKTITCHVVYRRDFDRWLSQDGYSFTTAQVEACRPRARA